MKHTLTQDSALEKPLDVLIRRCTFSHKPRIAVVGDLMVDEYYHVDASRVSPEFPIPVLRCDVDQPDVVVPAGAGNLANQFKYLNANLSVLGFLDLQAQPVYRQAGLNTEHCVIIPTHVPIKRRFYQGQFPLCRWDVEGKGYGLHSLESWQGELYNHYLTLPDPEVIIFADYNKGVFPASSKNSMMESFPDAIKIVDPKAKPIERWKGCTIFKPNQKEAQELSGIPSEHWQRQCDFFQRMLDCIAVVITHGGDGVYGKVMDRYFDYHSAYTTECESVIGAGDCFAAVLGIAMAHAIDVVEAINIAYEAGAVYVGKKYNEPIMLREVAIRLDPLNGKFTAVNELRNRNFKLVVTNGCFDILHPGHIEMLRFAKSKGDKLLVLVDDDEHVRQMKGEGRPINNVDYRMKMLAALECVDFVNAFPNDEVLLETYKSLQPEVLVKDDTWPYIIGEGIAKETIRFHRVEGYATTNVVEKIKKAP